MSACVALRPTYPRGVCTLQPDVGAWLAPQRGRTSGVVVSVAHVDDDERALVLGVLLEEVLSWVRTLPGSQRLRALIVFDEVHDFLPPGLMPPSCEARSRRLRA